MVDDRFGSLLHARELDHLACQLGASCAKVISTADMVLEDHLADMCQTPGCENYGLAASCPPHVEGPSVFRKWVNTRPRAVVFKIDVPSEILLSPEGREVFKLLHEIAASVEQVAIQIGYKDSMGFAGGSCKKLFCESHPDCRVITDGGRCRNPEYARPSMSGYGINVQKLMEVAGWTMNRVSREKDGDRDAKAPICGLVLIG